MGRENAEERLFSEKIDRWLAGGEIQTDPTMADDLCTALDFARQMTTLRQEPSSRFRTHLKAALLQKLDEQAARSEAGKGWLSRLMHQPVWQAVAVLVFMFIVGGVVWGSGVFSPSKPGLVNAPPPTAYQAPTAPATIAAPAPTAAPATSAPASTTTAAPTTTSPGRYLAATGSTNKFSYLPGETVSIHMEWQNVSSQTLTIDEFPPILSIMEKSTGQAVFTFSAGKTAKTLAPGEKAEYLETWNQLDTKGRQAAPESYYLELEEMYYQGRAVPMTLTKPVNFIIQ